MKQRQIVRVKVGAVEQEIPACLGGGPDAEDPLPGVGEVDLVRLDVPVEEDVLGLGQDDLVAV